MTIADEGRPFIALLIPSKGRPNDAYQAVKGAHKRTLHNQDIVAVIDEDSQPYADAGLAFLVDTYPVSKSERVGFVDPMNEAAMAWTREPMPKYIGFMGDDHRIRTDEWDRIVLERNEAFVYGNDLWQGANLPTAVFIRADVVKALGYFAPPVLQHLYADNAWLELGRASGSIVYLPELIIEHMHPAAGKGVMDELKVELNADSMKSRDERAFREWMANGTFASDVEKVRACVQSS